MKFPITTVLLLYISLLPTSHATEPECKCVPTSHNWPTPASWAALNATVSGALIRTVPPGAPCYPSHPSYNTTLCASIRTQWHSSSFHAANPASVGFPQWADDPCPPIWANGTSVNGDVDAGRKGCGLGAYPVYVINATTVGDVVAAVRFAGERDVRVGVKSTGHSFVGRSTGYGSLSVWTHYMRGIRYHEAFRPESCAVNASHAAFAIAAGSRVRDVYEAANKEKMIVVAGSAQDVGIVGWAGSGGHGPLSSTYGMGADNILQATVVTPDGEVVVANKCSHPDLYWAIRGGGAGTFGIVTEVVMKAFPDPTGESVSYSLEMDLERPNATAFWDAFAYFMSEFPRLKSGGLSGYHLLFGPPLSPSTVFAGSFSVWGEPNGTAMRLMGPVKEKLAEWPGLNFTISSTYSSSFFEAWNTTIGYEGVGTGSAVLGSRLIPAHPLKTDSHRVSQVFRNLTDGGLGVQIYAVANSANRGLDVALNPAWRDAVMHAITVNSWADGASKEVVQQGYDKMTYNLAPQLKSLAPESGAYHNECDPHDPNWQYDFFGTNYERLRSIKRRYDPKGVLWCLSCVGSEEWEPDETGRLCRSPWLADR